MLERVLEPEVMDSIEEALAYDAMDHTAVNLQFAQDLLAAGGYEQGEILDLGTGTALIPIELCRLDPELRVLGVDMSVSMLDVARNNIEVFGFRERITVDRADAKRLPFEDGRFAAVISNSILHHLPDPRSAVEEALRVVRPGGRLFFRDLCRPDSEDMLRSLVARYADGETVAARRMFEDSLRAALSLEEFRMLVSNLGFGTDTVRSTSDRHWTWTATAGA